MNDRFTPKADPKNIERCDNCGRVDGSVQAYAWNFYSPAKTKLCWRCASDPEVDDTSIRERNSS